MANPSPSSTRTLHRQFLTFLPRIELQGRVYFRHLRCEQTRQDAIAEMVALAWKWFLRLVQRGRYAFALESLPRSTRSCHELLYGRPRGQGLLDGFEERLRDNTVTPPEEQAIFRIDFPAWLCTRTDRERRIIQAMARNERTQDLSRAFGVSPGRISQLRREFHADWQRYTGEASECPKEVRQ
jgi:hypothetical protein